MTEQELQRIENGFAAATPLKYYNPHGDRSLADIMVDLESRTIVPLLIAEVRELRAKLDAVPVEALRFWRDPFGAELTAERIDAAWDAITAWLDAQAVPA